MGWDSNVTCSVWIKRNPRSRCSGLATATGSTSAGFARDCERKLAAAETPKC